ncbi:MAG TPA: class I SAM-dependent methyltransferase [Candidatus Saccharimonadales bacterium]|nr:class I SAM-dependent methyltransferase [Candidatus Saccharimonadales bacterium]
MNLFGPRLKEDYDEAFASFGPGPKALLWWDYRSMAIRFRELVKEVPIDGKSVLDVGCGMGDLLPYLYAKSTNFRYLGVDKSAQFIKVAKQRYEGHQFKVGDPFARPEGMFDVVLLSGVMNGNVDNWLAKRKKMIKALWDQTGEVLAFNMAGGLKPIKADSLIAYADAQVVLDYCKTMSHRVVLKTDYLEKDFTIVMFKTAYSD